MAHQPFTMLGIESSCDETSAAIILSNKTILANKVASQIKIHSKHGGVVPEVAARAHLELIDKVILETLNEANLTISEVGAVAATAGPGLIGGVAVGTSAAKAIAAARKIPYYAVNHLEGHALSPRLVDEVPFPYLLLLVSGGHTQLLGVAGVGHYCRYGTTMDDAAGEAFDKCAKAMRLDYPGGPAIEAIAKSGNANAISFPRPLLGSNNCHFSFSGLKTAFANKLNQLGGPDNAPLADLAASLQAAIADCLADRTKQAMAKFCDQFPLSRNQQPSLVIAGGVAANQHILNKLKFFSDAAGFRLSVPPAELCTDNAAIIAWAALERLEKPDAIDFVPRPRWPLDPNASPPPGRGVRQ